MASGAGIAAKEDEPTFEHTTTMTTLGHIPRPGRKGGGPPKEDVRQRKHGTADIDESENVAGHVLKRKLFT